MARVIRDLLHSILQCMASAHRQSSYSVVTASVIVITHDSLNVSQSRVRMRCGEVFGCYDKLC